MVLLHQTRLYKALTPQDWELASQLGHTQTVLDETDGYVHLSDRGQIEETLRLYYSGIENVQLLEFVMEQMSGRLVWETSRGGAAFPHLYDKLSLSEISRQWCLKTDVQGCPIMPADIDAPC